MTEVLKKRSEVPVEQTWDLSLIYQTEEEMLADAEWLHKTAELMESQYRGKLDSAEIVTECVSLYRQFIEKEVLVGDYLELAVSVDYSDNHYQELGSKVMVAVVFAQVLTESLPLSCFPFIIRCQMYLLWRMNLDMQDILKPAMLHSPCLIRRSLPIL